MLLLLGVVVLAVGAGAYATYRISLAEADAMFDYHLRQLALSLRDQAFARAFAPRADIDNDDFDFVVQVRDATGVRLYLSHPHKVLPLDVQLGFSTVKTEEGRWRVFAQIVRGQVVEVAQPMAVRSRMALSAALQSVWPFLAVLPALALAIWWVVGRGLAPLDRLARGVAARSPSAMDPLPESRAPVEVQPLVHSLNDLLERLRSALDAQRAFVADAAHGLWLLLEGWRQRAWHPLRSPLAAVCTAAILFLPWLGALLAQTASSGRNTPADLSSGFLGLAVKVVYPFVVFSAGQTIYPWNPLALAAILLSGLLALAGLAGLFRRRPSIAWLLLGWIGGSLIFTLLILTTVAEDITFLNMPSRAPNIAPAFSLLIALGSLRIPARWWRAAALAPIGLAFALGLSNYYQGREFHNPIYAVPVRAVA
ncbi:MAG: hypothetical protein ABI831_22145, partial [Betaproteobacteria bacterium]